MDGPCSPRLKKRVEVKTSPQTENGVGVRSAFPDRPRGHRASEGDAECGLPRSSRGQWCGKETSLSPPSTSLHFLLASRTVSYLLLPLPHWPLLFLPGSSLSPPPFYWKQLRLWWLRTGLVEGREARAVYRNWSSSIHQLCLELETKHNKYLGSSPAVLSLNLAI